MNWAVEGTGEELQEILAENSGLAEESHEDTKRQVLEEVAKGTMLSEAGAKKKSNYGGRLAVAEGPENFQSPCDSGWNLKCRCESEIVGGSCGQDEIPVGR